MDKKNFIKTWSLGGHGDGRSTSESVVIKFDSPRGRLLFIYLLFINLINYFWLRQVLVAAHGIFRCGAWASL